ncbi:hypothetical protein CRYUN_Cryun25bG0120000 [Craigia yunnanensis]
MAETTQKPHAIFVPYPLQGHVIPSVHLAIKLASKGFTITFINTHSIHHQTSKAQPAELGPDIFATVRESGLDIRYTTVSDDLPVGFDRSLNQDQFMAALLHVFSAPVEEVVGQIVRSGERVHCLIADTSFVWPSKIAKKFGLLYVSYWTEPALVFTLYYHLDLLRINGHFGCQDCREDTIDYIPGVRAVEPRDMMSYLQETDITTELEHVTISALHATFPFYAIGPIFPSGFTNSIVATSLWSESDCTQWLDKKPHDSVLYVSFGSDAHVKKTDLIEIANGLLLSKVNFLWVLRPDIVSSDDADPLPVGFKEEVGDRAMIIPWCCQNAVLAHPAIGGKLVVDDWKTGINLSNKKHTVKEEVSDNVHRLMSEKSGDQYRKKVKEVKETLENALAPNGSSEKNMDQFIKKLKAKIQIKPISPQ